MKALKDSLPKFDRSHESIVKLMDHIDSYPDGAMFLKCWVFVPSYIVNYIGHQVCSSDSQMSVFEADGSHSKERTAEGTFFNIVLKVVFNPMHMLMTLTCSFTLTILMMFVYVCYFNLKHRI